jgi:NAD(P)-dependent dehydrogenase (short-subunit alcohol dehydrogenase family)
MLVWSAKGPAGTSGSHAWYIEPSPRGCRVITEESQIALFLFFLRARATGLHLATWAVALSDALERHAGRRGNHGGKLNDVKHAIERQGGHAVQVVCDMSDLASVRRAAAQIIALDLRIAGLLNNAGVQNPSVTKNAAGWDMTFVTNHLGPFALTEALPPHLENGANVLFVGSATEDPERAGFRGGRYISAEASARGEWKPGGAKPPHERLPYDPGVVDRPAVGAVCESFEYAEAGRSRVHQDPDRHIRSNRCLLRRKRTPHARLGALARSEVPGSRRRRNARLAVSGPNKGGTIYVEPFRILCCSDVISDPCQLLLRATLFWRSADSRLPGCYCERMPPW